MGFWPVHNLVGWVIPDSKVHGATWGPPGSCQPQMGPVNLSISVIPPRFDCLANILKQKKFGWFTDKSLGHLHTRRDRQYIKTIIPGMSISMIKKSKDYVYGIWVYKALGIWKGYYRVKKSLVSYMKPWTEARNNKYMKYHSKLTYQLSFWNVSRKVDYHAGGKWFIHGLKIRRLRRRHYIDTLPWDRLNRKTPSYQYSNLII